MTHSKIYSNLIALFLQNTKNHFSFANARVQFSGISYTRPVAYYIMSYNEIIIVEILMNLTNGIALLVRFHVRCQSTPHSFEVKPKSSHCRVRALDVLKITPDMMGDWKTGFSIVCQVEYKVLKKYACI